MAATASLSQEKKAFDISLEVGIRLVIVGALIVWCFKIFSPFLMPIMWGGIIAVAIFPLFSKAADLMGGRRGLTALLFTLLAIALIVIPSYQVTDSVVRSAIELDQRMDEGLITVPAPKESVREWPVVGERVYAAWDAAHANLSTARERYQPQVQKARSWVLDTGRGLAGGLLLTILALIIAGFMVTFVEGEHRAALALARRLGGARGERLVGTMTATIRSVAQGVLGVAAVQALAAGLGMFLAGIPGWGIWTVLVLVLAVVQLPPLVVLGPVLAWYFTLADSMVAAVIFAIWALIVSVSDTFLKPIFLGRGVDIPMPVILIGAIGGVILHGIIGLFVGAVVLAIGYELFKAWMAAASGGENAAAG
jgi:predicted PurR-regulated permease PerM